MMKGGRVGIHIKSGYYEYTIPINPQSYALNPQPRYTIAKTIGGRFIQLLGAHYEGTMSGLLTTTNTTLDEQWATQHLFETFMTHVYENQKNVRYSRRVCSISGADAHDRLDLRTYHRAVFPVL